ncbi:tRNA (adenosine(37)-N6)-threonylcarbamoyltransferase complex dimerization subunit type 1 TsaB [Comamonas piscis]|uniref:tRNA (Adenosine(37)-N6)-threonylcarbamoyltransferase complex dimerization subunit type 1 TsaB n=1 Tax=Comamonas piscis TaxID=1562974 RepID=A0A7G5EDN3_9BURK|nr:tRNA (adenosine(37)-N6)-threonylcarbamoyltransferase complex dimerization subunit type 1 TsaB [Comamonas piscis]QMV72108.1 tRNA (adenosine(37)-N6)-threonylcarbamoyltransferase complex dimerization subunit type 1 TsaB [Comamonas piscis]WSO34857.1 tRNA (adenosine(37)-N6)-threonylcarbamoyltransferase complex dimerization subunit type 1 TsaB [Comamonas piscis]
MNLLALESSTDTLFIATARDDQRWLHSGAGGQQTSSQLLPAVLALMADAGLSFDALDAIVFGRGPGSFTGLRTACAIAQGLAFVAKGGQGVPVLPVDTLMTVAEEARLQHGCTQVLACVDARMDEVYNAVYQYVDGHWQTLGELQVCPPQAVQVPAGFVVAGNAHAIYGERLAPAATHLHAMPTAQALLSLAPYLLAQGQAVAAQDALPLYIRDKVAKTTAEREAEKLAQAALVPSAPSAPNPTP